MLCRRSGPGHHGEHLTLRGDGGVLPINWGGVISFYYVVLGGGVEGKGESETRVKRDGLIFPGKGRGKDPRGGKKTQPHRGETRRFVVTYLIARGRRDSRREEKSFFVGGGKGGGKRVRTKKRKKFTPIGKQRMKKKGLPKKE